jgi:hypothetical protein
VDTPARPPEKNCERLVAQNHKGGERNEGQLGEDRADGQKQDFTLGLPIHVLATLRDTDRSRAYWEKRLPGSAPGRRLTVSP